jgi:hypothetical protein
MERTGWLVGYAAHPGTGGGGGAGQQPREGGTVVAGRIWLRRVAGALVRLIYLQARAHTNARDALWDLRAEIADRVARAAPGL